MIAKLKLPPEVFVLFQQSLTTDEYFQRVIKDALPDDAVLVEVDFNSNEQCFELLLESDDFDDDEIKPPMVELLDKHCMTAMQTALQQIVKWFQKEVPQPESLIRLWAEWGLNPVRGAMPPTVEEVE